MKKVSSLIFMMIFAFANAQNQEFTTHKNGLIYSEYAMNKLSEVVNSLNLQFEACDFDKTFYGKKQTKAHYIRLKSGNIQQALKDLNQQMDFETFVKKYPQAKVEKDILVVQFNYKNYKEEDVVDFSEVDVNHGSGISIEFTQDLERFSKDLKNTWVFDYTEKSEYWNESVSAFFFPEAFKTQKLPDAYARMVGYADCLIDTTAVKFKKDARQGYVEMPKKWRNFSQNKKEGLLDKLRSTQVIGSCSMDNSPRVHAVNIALLSAETLNWKIFLRSHLDILNDNFQRMSDGSYAWEGRKTYIKELEVLDINVPDLVFGIALRVENPAKNHYYGSISRLGRAISESNNKQQIEDSILAMIKDEQLDAYNRILNYFLFLNYNHYTQSKPEKIANRKKLENAIATLPNYLKDKIMLDKIE
jgi:hypothetical protein